MILNVVVVVAVVAAGGIGDAGAANVSEVLSPITRDGYSLQRDSTGLVVRGTRRCRVPLQGIIHIDGNLATALAQLSLSAFSATTSPKTLSEFRLPATVECEDGDGLTLKALDLSTGEAALQLLANGIVMLPAGAARVKADLSVRGKDGSHFPETITDAPLVGSFGARTGEVWLSGTLGLARGVSIALDIHAIDIAHLTRPIARAVIRREGDVLVLDGAQSAQPQSKGGGVCPKLTHYFWEYRRLDGQGLRVPYVELGDAPILTVAPLPARALFTLTVVNEEREHAVSSVVVDPR